MASKRKFYRTVVTVEVLSEQPLDDMGLDALNYAITEGDCVGRTHFGDPQEIEPADAADRLREMGSEPGFFQLDDKGDDIEDDDHGVDMDDDEKCPECGEPLRPVMVDTDGTNLEESKGCKNKDCSSNQE
jgi:hypothetical protein